MLQQLDAISRGESSNQSVVRDSSDEIVLKRLHLSPDYGIILTWSVNMQNDEFTCDAVFVYQESNADEILLDNSPVCVLHTYIYIFRMYVHSFFHNYRFTVKAILWMKRTLSALYFETHRV